MTTIEQKMNSVRDSLSAILLETLDENLFFAKLGEYVKEIFTGDRVMVYMALDNASVLMSVDGSKNFIGGSDRVHGIASHVVKTKRAYYTNSVKRDPLVATARYEFPVVAELSAPIIVDGAVLGTINLLSSNENRNFSEADIATINSLLNTIKTPLSNMKMYLMAKNLNRELLRKIEEKELAIKRMEMNRIAPKREQITLIGQSTQFIEIMSKVNKVSQSNVNLLISGAIGTGKEFIARKIHNDGARSAAPFVVVNCSGLKDAQLEIELFGIDSGISTQTVDRQGLVERASGGTIVFDEIANISHSIQAKLLRLIESGEFYRVGSSNAKIADVRIIALTSREMGVEVAEGRFREDLLLRLNTVPIRMPTLSERRDDIRPLAEYFLNSNLAPNQMKSLTYSAVEVLAGYNWPGNIRELKNIMERVQVLSEGTYIDANDLPEHLKVRVESRPVEINDCFVEMTMAELEKKHICDTLRYVNGNKTKTARILGITVKTLYNKLHNYNLLESEMV